MSGHLGSSRYQELFVAAVHNYEMRTGIALIQHPLAEKLQNCDSVESVTAVLRENMQAFSGFRENDKVLRRVENAVSVLYQFSARTATTNFGHDIGLVRP